MSESVPAPFPTRIAAVDLGSNAIRLLVAEVDERSGPDGALETVARAVHDEGMSGRVHLVGFDLSRELSAMIRDRVVDALRVAGGQPVARHLDQPPDGQPNGQQLERLARAGVDAQGRRRHGREPAGHLLVIAGCGADQKWRPVRLGIGQIARRALGRRQFK